MSDRNRFAFLDRDLSLWIFLAMGLGALLGYADRLHWPIPDPARDDSSPAPGETR